ncbi:hypothetical protein SME02_004944 [Klebsiella aerogenes]|nr:hypothetical protein [Klebsiella aerogenes]ELY3087843.1 hypothetical protein [Klebsiella aerogenes]
MNTTLLATALCAVVCFTPVGYASPIGAGAGQHYPLRIPATTNVTHSLVPALPLVAGHRLNGLPVLSGDVWSSTPAHGVALQWGGGEPGGDDVTRIWADTGNPDNKLVLKFAALTAGTSVQDGGDGLRYFVIPAGILTGQHDFRYQIVLAGDQFVNPGRYDVAVNAWQWTL